MSAVTIAELAYPPGVLAEELDYDFQDIAELVPCHSKLHVASGEIVLLHSVAGVGRLQTEYLGNFMIRITAIAEGFDNQLGFYKDYELRDHYEVPGGRLHATCNTEPEDLDGCPAPLATLAHLVKTLRDGYIEATDPEAPGADIIMMPLPRYTGTLE